MKLTDGVDFKEETYQFCAQMGVTHVKIDGGRLMDDDQRGVIQHDALRDVKKQADSHGLKIGVALLPQPAGTQHWNIRLGKPEREQEIDDVCKTLEILGQEGVPTAEYVFNLAAVFGSTSEPTGRGGAVVRNYDHEKALQAPEVAEWAASEDEIWDRIKWFLERAIPCAESAGVNLACHPDDPPVPKLKGETRVTGSFEGMKRLMELVPSDANGLNFCQGTVAEMGVDVIEMIRYFGSRKKIHHVHFRNIKRAIPNFEESFIDDGDTNMFEALKAYKEVDFQGTIMPDHWPTTVGNDRWAGRAQALGYLKALMDVLDVYEPA